MRSKSALVFIIFLLIAACNLPTGGPAFATAEPLGPSKDFPTWVPSLAPPGFGFASDSISQLIDGSSAVHLNGRQVVNQDGTTQNIDPYWITAAPISNQQYLRCVEVGTCSPPDASDNPQFFQPTGGVFPITGVTLDQAADYCQWMGGELPTSGQSWLSEKEVPAILAALLQASVGLVSGSPTQVATISACDLKPAGSPGCPAPTISACDLKPAGSPGCPAPTISACDLKPAGTPGCPTKVVPTITACDLKPAGAPGCPTKVVPTVSACSLVPGGCPATATPVVSGGSGNIFAALLNGILSSPNTSGYGTYSDDSSLAGSRSYKSPSGEIVTVDENTHPSNISFKCVIKDVHLFAPYCQTTSYIPNTKGNYPAPVCPNISIEQKGQYCSSDIPFVNVDVQGADFISVDPPAKCTEDPANSTAESTRVICTDPEASTFTLSGESQCSAPADWKPNAVCLNGYSYDAVKNICIYSGFETGASACPSGFTFSPDAKCCVSAKDYQPVCTPGYYYSPLGCISYDSTYLQVDQTISLASCTTKPGGGNPGGGSSCTLTCTGGDVLDPVSCTCKPFKP